MRGGVMYRVFGIRPDDSRVKIAENVPRQAVVEAIEQVLDDSEFYGFVIELQIDTDDAS